MLLELSYMYKTIALTILTFISVFLTVNCLKNDNTEAYMIGRIINIDSISITESNSITLIDRNEKIWKFDFEDEFNHFTPSHLKEHMISGDLIKIIFLPSQDSRTIVDITDYP